MKTNNLVQYTENGPGYSAIGVTVKELEAGYYDIARDGSGNLIYVRKPLNTDRLLRLSDTKSDQVVAEIEHFWTLRDRFRKYGLIHKRGFLLYGPPGSGKTSTISIVTQKMIADGGVVINGAGVHMAYLKQALQNFREVEPTRPLVLTLEDIDESIKADEPTLLSILDGDANIANVVFIATTNHPEKLEARVINRPSRFDRVVRIGMPDQNARRQYIEHCDPEIDEAETERWVELTDGFSVAQIKECVIGVRCLGGSIEETVSRLRSTEIPNEKREAKQARSRTFFERFHEVCSLKLAPEQFAPIRDEAIKALNGIAQKASA